MRVISQNGIIDVPYEYFAFSMVGIGSCYSIIATRNIAEPPTVAINSVIATYSAKEKAVKAMEMLRETYASMPLAMQNVELTEDEIKAFEKIKKCGVMIRAENQPPKVECISNTVFQFPQDDEIEVVE